VSGVPPTSDRAVAIDLVALAAFVALACALGHHLAVMTVAVPALIVARTVAFALVPRAERGPLSVELLLLGALTVLGAFNDWRTVVVHGVYDYTVPTDLGPGTLPLWMLLAWGLILRGVFSVATWGRLGPPPRWPAGGGLIRSGPARALVMLALVAITRPLIYAFYLDPWLSWLPFAAALAVAVLLLGLDRGARWLALIALLAGPAVEALLIGAGGLHRYALGWVGGVPVWICLWWVVASVFLRELGWHARAFAARKLAPGRAGTAPTRVS